MATVTKDFRVKNGLVVEGENGTIDGFAIITTDQTKFDTDDVKEGAANLYFTNQRAIDAVGGSASPENTALSVVKRDASGNFEAGDVTANGFNVGQDGSVIGALEVDSTNVKLTANNDLGITADNVQITTPLGGGSVTIDGDIVATLTDSQVVSNKTISTATLGTDLDADGHKITNVATPVDANDAANKGYVDAAVSGLDWKESVNLFAKTQNVALTGNTGTLVIDGHAALDSTDSGYRLLLAGQTTTTENGIYVYTDNGTTYTLSRSVDADTVAELLTAAVFIAEGTSYGATSWVQNNHYADTFDDLTWTQFSGQGTYLAGTGIDLNGNVFDIDLSEVSTTTLPEGTNLYYTNERVDDRVAALVTGGKGITVTYDDNGNALALNAEFTEFNTSDVVEDPAGTGTSGTLYFTNARAVTALEAVVPKFTAVEVNQVAKQVAATQVVATPSEVTAFEWEYADYKSAKFFVKTAYSTHTEVSEVIITTDTSYNTALTEYAVVGTNGQLSTISAECYFDGTSQKIGLLVTTLSANTSVMVTGTLLK